MRSKRARILAALLGVVVAIQFVPLSRDNPPATAPLALPEPVQAVLARACYDCHSNATRWPWYSRVAPVGWLLSEHVHEGREKVDFSTAGGLPEAKQAELPRRCFRQVQKGDMPLRSYLWMHREARLAAADQATLRAWAESAPPLPPGAERPERSEAAAERE